MMKKVSPEIILMAGSIAIQIIGAVLENEEAKKRKRKRK